MHTALIFGIGILIHLLENDVNSNYMRALILSDKINWPIAMLALHHKNLHSCYLCCYTKHVHVIHDIMYAYSMCKFKYTNYNKAYLHRKITVVLCDVHNYLWN